MAKQFREAGCLTDISAVARYLERLRDVEAMTALFGRVASGARMNQESMGGAAGFSSAAIRRGGKLCSWQKLEMQARAEALAAADGGGQKS